MKTNNIKKIITTGFISLLMITFIGCANIIASGVKGNGKVISKERVLQVFTSIDVSGAANIYLTQNDTQNLTIETDENLEPIIITEVKDGVLKIYNKENINNPTKLNIYISVKELNNLKVSGANDIIMKNKFKSSFFQINCSGASDLKLNLESTTLNIASSGAGDIELEGSATDVVFDISGASEISAYQFACKNAKINMSGAGSIKINASDNISGKVSGASALYYKGKPSINNLSVSGVAKISESK